MGVISLIKRTRLRRSPFLRLRSIPTKYLFLITLIIFLLLIIQTFLYVERSIGPNLKEVARFKVEQLATKAINDAISKKMMQGTDFRQLVELQRDKNGQVQTALFNNNEYARIVAEAMARVTNALDDMESVPYQIPLGQVFQSNLLASLGPNIPVTLVPMGTAQVDVETRMQNAGINNVLVTAVMVIQAKVKILIPFSTEPAVIKSEIPLSTVLIVGNVPQFYYDGNGNPVASAQPGMQAPSIVPPIQANTSVQKQQ